jgi:deoxycytidine triphosphate deaminase
MLMTDGNIKAAMASGDLVIEGFSDSCLEAASYDMRAGSRLLISDKAGQIPRADEDYPRTLGTQSLSELGQSLRTLTQNVGSLTNQVSRLASTQKNI